MSLRWRISAIRSSRFRKLGPLESILGMMPQLGPLKDLKNVKVDEGEITRIVAIIDSMTPKERDNHMIISGSAPAPHRQRQRVPACRK